ncbi:DUF6054 family protein [Clostridium septicum]|uniref:DUF6054 family protein n=1 Tax=Clostridium septicum TaxID=1504 RepID=UPI00272EAAAA|nr:DUF6054 family protein [Clostridium septicum]WLF70915.1 DUF6054 family protein [Clostridium septicum]
MGADDFRVNLSLKETIRRLDSGIVDGSFTGERIDYYVVMGNDENGVIVLVYEKHFQRAGNRLTLTVTVDNMNGFTKIHSIASGGGQGLFRFDWGAGEKFTCAPRRVLEDNII